MIPKARSLLALTALAAVALAAGGCGGGSGTEASSSTQKTLVFSPAALAIPTLKQEAATVTEIAKSAGWKTTVVDPNFNPTKQVQQIQQAINSGQAGAIWVVPVDAKALSGVISLAQSKGIPVALTGAPTDFGLSGAQKGIVFDAAGAADYGDTIAEQAAACVESKLGGKGQALLVTQNGTQSGAAEQVAAIKKTLAAKSPGTSIVGSELADTQADAQSKVSQLLQSNPGANTVLATSDEDSLGALGAFKAAGKSAPCIVSGGGGPEAIAAAESGDLYAVVAFDYTADAHNVFSNIQELAKDPTAVGAIGDVPIVVKK